MTLTRHLGVVFLGSSLLTGAFGASARPRLGRLAEPTASRRTVSAAGVWRSETTKNEYRVQVSANSLTAVWINVPKSMQRRGAYIRTECRRVGPRWIGTTRSYLPFSCGPDTAGHQPPVHWCHILTRTEISDIAAARIEGRGEALKAFDCDHCKVLQKEWKPFAWTPASGR